MMLLDLNRNVNQSQDLDLSQMVLLDWHLHLQRLRDHSSPTTVVKMKLLLTASWLMPQRCNTQKIGLSIFVLLFLPTFPSRKFSPGHRLMTGKIQEILILATSAPALVASHDPFSRIVCPGICENVATLGATFGMSA